MSEGHRAFGATEVAGGPASAFRKYQDLVIGSRSLSRLLLYEAVQLFASWVPGALGLALRRAFYPWILGTCGRGVVFGTGVTLRHPHKIHLADGVVIDDHVMLDAKGHGNEGIAIGRQGFVGRGSILSCKDGDITLGPHANIGFHSEIFSASRVEIGEYALFAAYTYVVGGGHAYSDPSTPTIRQERTSKGVSIGRNVWLGAGAKVLDGVTIGSNVVVGAGAVVTRSLPDGVVAAGVPAEVVKTREEPAALA